MQNSSSDDDSLDESDSQFESEFEEISASTGGHSSLHESGQMSDSNDEDIFSYEAEIVSEGDINSSHESIYYESSYESSYVSSSAEISLSAQEQQEGQHQLHTESDSSSSSTQVDFDFASSSSSSGSLPISSPQHHLANQVTEEERDSDISNRQESGSEKLKRILYGPTSSYSEDDLLTSSSDSSTSSTYGKFEDDDIILRGTNHASSTGGANFGNITTGNDQENDTVDVHDSNINETTPEDDQGKNENIISWKNEEQFDLPTSGSPKSLDIFHDESFDYEESFSVLEQIDEEDEEEDDDDDDDDEDDDDDGVGRNEMETGDAISSASSSDTNSKSYQENDKGKDVDSRDYGTTSPEASLNDHVAKTTTEADSKEDDHGKIFLKNIQPESPRHSPVVDTDRKQSSDETETEPKSSTIWVASGRKKDINNEANKSSSDKVGWKPPALTTFSPSSYEKKPQAYENEKTARDTSDGPKLLEISSNLTEAKTMKRKVKASKTGSTPPIPVIEVDPFFDDDSTLGTVGTYLERMPELRNNKTKQKRLEKKKQEKSATVEFISTLNVSKTEANAARAKGPARDNSGKNLTDNGTAYRAQRLKETSENVSGFRDSFEDDLPISTDPPGDSYLFEYDLYDEHQPLLLPPKALPRDNIDHIDKTWKSSEPSSSVGPSILTHQTPSQYVISSSSPMSPWVPTSIQDTGKEVDNDPTRAFINSIISDKRSMVTNKSRVTGNGYSKPESKDTRERHISQSSSKNISEPEEIIPSEASSSQSYEINVFGESSPSISKRAKSAVSNSTSESKTTDSSQIEGRTKRLPQRRGSVSQLIEPKDIESGSNNSEHSRSSSSSSGSSKQDRSKRGNKVLQRRGSVSKLQRRGSVSKLQRRGSVSMLQRRGSMSRLFRRRSKGSENSERGGMDQVIRMLQRRGSMSRLVQYWSKNDDESESSSSSSSDPAKEHEDYQLKRMPQRRGSVTRIIQHGTNIDDESASSSSSSRSSKEEGAERSKKMPQRRGSVSRLIQYGSNNSENSGSWTSATAKGTSTKQDLEMRNRKTTIILLWSTVILIVASIIVIVVLWQLGIRSEPNDNDSNDPTSSLPTPKPTLSLMPSADGSSDVPSLAPVNPNLFDLIIENYPQSQEALEDPTSPQSKALKWLQSPVNSEMLEDRRFLQRFALATLYYATNGDGWTDNSGWLSEQNECNWMSKSKESICSELGDYVTIDLQENNLNGTLPAELGILSDTIQTVVTRENSLSGEIPFSILSDLKGLQVLDLSSNGFSGVLVQELFNATNLTRLSLFENKISSSIPSEIGQLKNLTVLDLGSNELSSTIPPTISELTKLAGLSLFDNKLTGTIPTELSDIKSLRMLYIDSNNLEAPVPLGVCALNIEEFWGDCEKIQCTCCSTCCASNFGCFDV